jgi:hypothetical protein
MTTPPLPWEAHPPLPEEEFGAVDRAHVGYGDPDEDTGPIAVSPPDAATMEFRTNRDLRAAEPTAYTVTSSEPTQYAPPQYAPPPVPRPEDTYAGRFTAPLSVDPRSIPVKHTNSQPAIIAAAAVAAVALVALGVWWLWPSGDSGNAASDPVPTSTPVIDAAGRDKLMGLLPAGYSSEACTAEEAPEGAVAVVNCTRNADAGGPASATYTLMADADALDAAFERTVNEARVVNCPGRIQSPGPWRRNASPQKVAGTLLCSTPDGLAQVAWTTDSSLLLNVTRADPEGPTLDQLFTWWQSHS